MWRQCAVWDGSPPRLWGARLAGRCARQSRRFTPTPVGSAYWRSRSQSFQPVHPHACGERDLKAGRRRGLRGSPPRLWGARRESVSGRAVDRFTPTPVGSAGCSWFDSCRLTVHPHACGERCPSRSDTSLMSGSPPRLWGAHIRPPVGRLNLRFTPTPVGSAWTPTAHRGPTPVHPHACGEREMVLDVTGRPRGSPPRLWGALLQPLSVL